MPKKRKTDRTGVVHPQDFRFKHPKRPKRDIQQAGDGRFYSASSQREYDPVTMRAITKPKGPQGNQPQNVKGMGPCWDFFKYSDQAFAPVLEIIDSEVQHLQDIAREEDGVRTRISGLIKGKVPWFFIVSHSAGILLRVQIMIRDAVKYHNRGHYLECHFAEGRGPKRCMTFRSIEIYEFVKYLVSRFEEETDFAKIISDDDEDAEGEIDEEAMEAASEASCYEVINSVESEFALGILKPEKPSQRKQTSHDGINEFDIMQAVVKVPGGFSACKEFAAVVTDIAKELTGWYDLDEHAFGSSSTSLVSQSPTSLIHSKRSDKDRVVPMDLREHRLDEDRPTKIPGSCQEVPIALSDDEDEDDKDDASCSPRVRNTTVASFERYMVATEYGIHMKSTSTLGTGLADANLAFQYDQPEALEVNDEASYLLEMLEQERGIL